MVKTNSILTLLLFIIYGLSYSQPSQNLKKTVRGFTKVIADTSSSYLNYSVRLIQYIDPTANVDKITSTYFSNWKLNLDTASYLINIIKISIIYNEDKTKAKVWTEYKWKKKNGEIFSFLSFTSWDNKNKLWYRNDIEERFTDRRNL